MAPPNGPSTTYGTSRPMVAAPTQPAEWVVLYTYPSSAALYSQLPTSEAALAPISARAAGTARTSRYARAVVSPIASRRGGLGAGCQRASAPAETAERSSGHDRLTTGRAPPRRSVAVHPEPARHPPGRTATRTRHHEAFIPPVGPQVHGRQPPGLRPALASGTAPPGQDRVS